MKHPATALVVLLVAGCASITDGTDQTIIFSVMPRDARCTVVRDTVELGNITGAQSTITISKGAKDILINCSAQGYEPRTQRLVSATQTAGMMSVLFIDFGITDMVTGAMWKYPSSVSVALDRIAGGPVPQGATEPAYVPVPAPIARTLVPLGTPAPPVPVGQDSYIAERLARQQGCGDVGPATMIGKGPGYESYSIRCANGETMVLRCEFGNCRALR